MIVDSVLAQNVINIWAEKGKKWLRDLPNMVVYLSDYWGLSHLLPVSNMTYNFVSLAKQNYKQEVALKICCNNKSYQQELQALDYFNGQGVISLIDYHDESNALLLFQAIPGTSLKTLALTSADTVIKHYSEAINAMHQPNFDDSLFRHVSFWCEAIDRMDSSTIDKKLHIKAQEIKNWLLETITDEYVCHGDLHLDNILEHKNEWVAIDPKGIIGEKAFEAAAFDWLLGVDLTNAQAIRRAIQARTMKIASLLDISEQRLLAWVFIKAMISAQWFIEDKGNPENAFLLASHAYSLLDNL